MSEQLIEKKCFIVAPIDEEGSEIRKRSDDIMEFIIEPVITNEFGYKLIRSDRISKSGNITNQIIEHLIDDDIVLADLTGRNPNVFYELAIRHVVRKPYIQLIQKGERIPFDISPIRTIELNYPDWKSITECKNELSKYVKEIENSSEVDTPISRAINWLELNKSNNPKEKMDADIISMMHDIKRDLNSIKDPNFINPEFIDSETGLIIGKFKSVEDLIKGFKETQKWATIKSQELADAKKRLELLKRIDNVPDN